MSGTKPSFAIIRLTKVTISRDALRTALGIKPDKFGVAGDGSGHYAVLDVPDSENPWRTIGDMLATLGPAIAGLITERKIGSALLDVVFLFFPELVTRSCSIPSTIALAAGKCLIDIDVSTYPSDDGDSEDNEPA